MPELPEVQTIVSDLSEKISGDKITGFWSEHQKAIKIGFAKFEKEIKDAKIKKVRRIGKNILIDLDNGRTIYIHLKMTGHLLVKSKLKIKNSKLENVYFDDKVNQYIRHIFYLNGGEKTLEFSDLRKFGRLTLEKTDKVGELVEIKRLGVDPLDKKFSLNFLRELLVKSKKPIKIQIMEQDKIAGIGNIYASEILFNAGIDPTRKGQDLKKREIDKLYKSIIKILKKAIKLRGTSDSDYRDTSGAPGNFHKVLMVYRKEKQKCKKCDTIIRRIKQGQRSTFYCPKCQI